MSESGNFSSGGSSLNSSTPTEETQPPGTYSYGNFSSSHGTNLVQQYSNNLAPGGRPVFPNRNPVSLSHNSVSSKNYDIVPEISSFYDQYKSEKKRLDTFYDWSYNSVKKEDLARNGFIFLHSKDRTQCIFCRGVLSSWETGDIVELEHKKHCPECPFAFGYACGNIPLTSQNVADSRPIQLAGTIEQTYGKVPQSSAFEMNSMLPALPSVGQPVQNGISTTQPKYPDWGDEFQRLRTFRNWPTHMTQTPKELAKAGLLYMGNNDRVKCFWCGGELYDWEPQDTPWEEHAKWFSQCGYVRAMKGDAYIKYIKDKQTSLDVEPPVEERMKSPHVLAVLREGYTPEQVKEVFNTYGQNSLVSAASIVEAIKLLQRNRVSALNALQNRSTGTEIQQCTEPSTHKHVAMETEEVTEKEHSEGSNHTTEKKTPAAGSSTSEDVETVRLENAKLKDEKLCKICMDKVLCMTFLPCGHFATCEDCAGSLNECPICRKLIMQRVKIFWA